MADLEGFEEKNPAQLAPREARRRARRGGLQGRRALRSRDPTASSGTCATPCAFAPEPFAKALRALVTWYETGLDSDREAFDIAWVQNRDSDGRHDERLHRGLHGRARHEGRLGRRRLLRQSREDRRRFARWPRTRSGSRITCRSIRGTASRRCRACRRRRSRWSSRPATPARSRRSASTCRTISASARQYGSKSVSLSNVLDAYERSMPDSFRQEFAWDDAEVERAQDGGARLPAS